MNKTIGWILALIAVVAAVFFIFIFPKINEDNKDTGQFESTITESGASSQPSDEQLIIGEANAPRTIVEYGDYKCPNCTRFHTGSYAQLKQEYLDTGKAKLVFRNLPYIADDSRVAANGSYCAQEQDLFEKYHDAVYDYVANTYATEGVSKEFEDVLTADVLSGIIDDAEGNKEQFTNCLADRKYQDKVDSDLQASEDDGVSGTPTFLIAGEKIVGAQPISTFRALLEAI